MNATELAEARRHLLAERERTVAEWQDHGGAAGPGDDWDLQDPEERPTQISSHTIDRKIADDHRNLIEKIEFALMRIDNGTYCRCATCGAPIPKARLLAKPSVSLCLACQEIKDAAKP